MSSGSRQGPNRQAIEARRVAVQVLAAILDRGASLEDAFEDRLSRSQLELRDRAFARRLVAVTLRRLGQIDMLIARCLDRDLSARASLVRHILRIGTCQAVFFGTPPHAAVDTSVHLARTLRQGRHLAFINAVLRRLCREGPAWAAEPDSVRANTPGWLWSSWCDAFGSETAQAIAEAHLAEPPIDLTPRSNAVSVTTALADQTDAHLLPTGSIRITSSGMVADLPGYDAGDWWVQDAAAALPVRLLEPVSGQRVIDLCAAPGGKTAQLAAAGARVTAVDRSKDRLKRLESNLTRLRLNAEVVEADALVWRPEERADAVIVDAPCTATGTLRRRPDVAWHRTSDDVTALAAVQSSLIAAAADMVRPGGVVVYCTCSLQPEEGPDQRTTALNSELPLTPEPIDHSSINCDPAFVDGDGALRTRPDQWSDLGGIDGFYAMRLRRT